MENWLTILSMVVGFLGTGGIAVSTLLFRKATKRLKTAEAYSAEFGALSKTCVELRNQIEFCNGRLNTLQELLVGKDSYIGALTHDKHALEVKHAKNKSAINKAYECTFCPDSTQCPVLMQRTRNDEEYARKIEQQIK